MVAVGYLDTVVKSASIFILLSAALARSTLLPGAPVVSPVVPHQKFVVKPYQFGKGNPEGLKSGAFWFYYRLGFRPVRDDIREQAAAVEEITNRSIIQDTRAYPPSIHGLQ